MGSLLYGDVFVMISFEETKIYKCISKPVTVYREGKQAIFSKSNNFLKINLDIPKAKRPKWAHMKLFSIIQTKGHGRQKRIKFHAMIFIILITFYISYNLMRLKFTKCIYIT